jgi:hypothetical protein
MLLRESDANFVLQCIDANTKSYFHSRHGIRRSLLQKTLKKCGTCYRILSSDIWDSITEQQQTYYYTIQCKLKYFVQIFPDEERDMLDREK